jgi:hypothetical protein
MSTTHLLLAALALGAGACTRPGDNAQARELAGRVLKGTLAYPNSVMMGVNAGSDAAELRMSTPDDVPKVAAWFREALVLNHWELEHDATEKDGSVVIYAKQGQRPLWITLRPNNGGPGTTYSMIGAEVQGDSIK